MTIIRVYGYKGGELDLTTSVDREYVVDEIAEMFEDIKLDKFPKVIKSTNMACACRRNYGNDDTICITVLDDTGTKVDINEFRDEVYLILKKWDKEYNND